MCVPPRYPVLKILPSAPPIVVPLSPVVLLLLIQPTKLWVRMLQGAFECVSDVLAASEVKCLEIQTSSPYFCQTGIGDVVAAIEAECLKVRTSSPYFCYTDVGDVVAPCEVEFLEVRTSSCYFGHTGVGDVLAP